MTQNKEMSGAEMVIEALAENAITVAILIFRCPDDDESATRERGNIRFELIRAAAPVDLNFIGLGGDFGLCSQYCRAHNYKES